MTEPFIVYALPRSRTAWLSRFLTYGDWICYHEQAIYARDMDEVRAFLNSPNTGTAETAAAQGRHLIRHVAPAIREVVILRPVDEVVESMMNVDMSGVAVYDREKLIKGMQYGDRILRKVAREPNVLTLNYEDLDKKDRCAELFEHCLPYCFDENWWELLRLKNIQVEAKEILRYYFNNREAIEGFKNHCKRTLRKLYRLGEIPAKIRI